MYQYNQVTGFPLSLIDVEATGVTRINLKFKFTSSNMNYEVTLQPGLTYRIVYLDQGELKEIRGLIVGAYRHFSPSTQTGGVTTQTAEWIIRVDASEKNNALVVDIPTTQIRLCKIYTPHSDEDNNKITDTTTHGGKTYGTITRATVTNVKYDNEGNIISGDIVDGDIKPPDNTHTSIVPTLTVNGCSHGINGNGTPVVVEEGYTVGGLIISGQVVYAVPDGGTEEEQDGVITLSNTVLSNVVITNTTVKEGTTYNGKIIDLTFSNAIIVNSTRTGEDVSIIGAVVNPNVISTGGTATGGTVTGPIGYASQAGKWYILHGSDEPIDLSFTDTSVTPTIPATPYGISGSGGISSGGVGYGGIVSGGTAGPNGITVGATVTGGIYTGGTTYGATVSINIINGGWIEPCTPETNNDAVKTYLTNGLKIIDSSNYSTLTGGAVREPEHGKTPLHDIAFEWDGLIIWHDSVNGVGSNIKTVNL